MSSKLKAQEKNAGAAGINVHNDPSDLNAFIVP